MEKAKVYFTEEITPEALQKIYHALGVSLKGKVAVKISTGEPGCSATRFLRKADRINEKK